MIRVGIVGATGYTAFELLLILARHPHVQVTCVTSRDENCPALESVHPELRSVYDLQFEPLDLDAFCAKVDFAFCCLPHAASAEIVQQLLERSIPVVDFSADYRLNNVATFEAWYKVAHPDPDRVGAVAYGMPEFFREEIKSAKLVANPGCFPTSALLPLVPLVQKKLINPSQIIIDSKTGISGAGRKADLKFHFPECNESIAAYGVGTHRHTPEIENLIERMTGVETEVVFTPHLTPMNRGILSTIYVSPLGEVDASQIFSALQDVYRDEPFVRLVPQPPSTRHVSNSNFCDIAVVQARRGVILVSAIDNLVKGASGAAVQNFNLMMGLPETTALLGGPA